MRILHMKKLFIFMLAVMAAVLGVNAQQLPDPHFEDWSDEYNGDAQLKNWHGSNVTQVGFKFTFMYQKTGRSGYCAYVADREVGALGITEVAPGYMGLATAWQYLEGINTNSATAGMSGGISWKHRPDTMSVWIKRTGDNTGKEDFHLLYYSWKGTTKGTKYKAKNLSCTSTTQTNEESDVRQEMDGNECGTDTKATQIAEGWYRARAQYNQWTQIKVPIYYMSSEEPTMCNVIFSAGNYPNFRSNSGLYAGNGLWVDDVELIYSSKIQRLYIDDKEWKGFDPDSEEEQTYSLGEKATAIPTIEAWRGAGQLTNLKNKTASFNGRKLSGSEITITNGVIDGAPTVITVKAGDGSSTHTYKIKFVRAASTNANLAGININGTPLAGFKASTTTYNVELDYGTKKAPIVEPVQAEDAQTVVVTQPASTNGTATIKVTAADKKTTKTYTLKFSVAPLKDNTLRGIKVNGEELAGFVPAQTIYKVSLPLGTTKMPTIDTLSFYPAGAQTVVHTAPDKIDGGTYQLAVSSPGNPTAKVYKLNFKIEASTYSKLKDLKMVANGVNYLADFDPDNLTYYVNLPIGTTELPAISWVKGDQYQADPEIQEGGLDGTTRIYVTAASGAQTVYKIIVSTEKSDNSSLKNIFIGGKALDNFSPATYKYTYDLGVGVQTIPTITVTQGDEYQTVTISYGGPNEVTRVTVTAGDGSTTIYQITFTVKKSDNCTLKSIKVGGVPIANFNPETTEYYYTLAKGAAVPPVTYEKAEEGQTVNERKVTTAPGDYKLTVVAESGVKQTYIIHFVLNLSSNVELKAILLDDQPMADFVPATNTYEHTLPVGQSIIPEVSFVKGDNGQKVIVSESNNTYTLFVTAENGIATNTYTIKFIIQVSQNAFLDGIELDDKPLAGFRKDSFNYEYTLTGDMPTIKPVKADQGQQITVAAPLGVGTATIRVADEAGTGANTYYILFKKADSEAVLLNGIYQNGVLLDNWEPSKDNYTVHGQSLPVITYAKKDEQKVTQIDAVELQDGEKVPVTYIYVTAGGETKTYTVTFNRELGSDATLHGIWLNGVALADPWDANVFNYTRKLQEDESIPVITYAKKEDAQTVILGQKEENSYQLVVLAPDGKTSNTYTITFEQRERYSGTLLEQILLDGKDITNSFSKSNTYNAGKIAEGTILPKITYTKYKGQTVLVSDVSASQQQIVVVAESGASATYTINYTITKGDNVKLTGILLDGIPLKGFDPDQNTYTVTLDERTEVVPSITPQSNVVGQTYTITYGAVNNRTTVEVLAKDGQTKGYYFLDFKVRPLTSTLLSKLDIPSTGEVLMTDPTVTEYSYTMSSEMLTAPVVGFEKAEPEQVIEYTRGRGGETWIKVIAQNNDSRTYHVQFVKQKPTQPNVLNSLKINGETVELKDTILLVLPFGTTDLDLAYTTSFAEQSVLVNDGGVLQPTQLVVMANHPEVADKVYTIIPTVERFAKSGKLQSLTFNGNVVPNFQPDVYNYVVNVTAQPAASNFKGVTFDGKEITTDEMDNKKKQIVLKVPNGEIYTISWYYEHDGMYQEGGVWYSYLDFSGERWKKANKNGYKPYYWNVPGDYADTKDFTVNVLFDKISFSYTTGKEVMMGGENGAMLSTLRGASLNGSVPGMMSLNANMSVTLNDWGNSTFKMQGTATTGVTFRNTPEQFALDYNPLQNSGDITQWTWQLLMSNGSTYESTEYAGSFTPKNKLNTAVKDINYGSIGAVKRYTLLIKAANNPTPSSSAVECYNGGTISESSIIIQNLRFIYNSALTQVTVDGKDATISGTNITYEITDEEYNAFPTVKVKGQVEDQEQLFTWQDEVLNTATGKMERKALLRNFGEDHSYTDYNLLITRPAVTNTKLASVKWGDKEILEADKTDFTVYRTSAFEAVPDINITPASVHQQVKVTRNGDVFTIFVKPELGDAKTYTITFADKQDDDASLTDVSLKNVVLTPEFAKDKFTYTVSGLAMPVLEFTKANDLQSVCFMHSADSAKMVVTASDKKTANTYYFNLPAKQSDAELASLDFDGKVQNNPATGRKEIPELPAVALFTRKTATDSVAQTISTDSIEWRVFGADGKQNIYTFVTTVDRDHEARLAGVLVNGENYDKFDADEAQTIIPTDSMVNLEFIAANLYQTLTISLQTAQSANAPAVRRAANTQAIVFNVNVLAADGTTSKDYTFRLEAPRTSDATLQAIIIGNDTLTNITKTTHYSLTDADGPKREKPAMPKIQYVPTDPQAAIAVAPAGVNGTNYITVTPADNSAEVQYELIVESKSTYAQLDGVMIDGTPLIGFDPDRYFYSVEVEPGTHSVIPSSPDKFQTISQEQIDKNIIINVVAEDGIHSERYVVELYEASKSNNATLRGININGTPLADFEPMNNTYSYDLDPVTKKVPDVQGVMMVEGQTVAITTGKSKEGLDQIYLNVTAPDNEATNHYTITFQRQMSDDVTLKLITLDGDSIHLFDTLSQPFDPAVNIYKINLPVGMTELPPIYAQRNINLQKMPVITLSDMQAQITVTAENGNQGVYTLLFNKTYSYADSLLAVYADNKIIDGFTPGKTYYSLTLPVEKPDFPELTWETATEYQVVKLDTLHVDSVKMMCQIEVIADTTALTKVKNIYTITYERELWAVDTLQMIYVNNIPLDNFSANRFDYSVILPAGTTERPAISWDTNDKFKQRIEAVPSKDSIATKSLNEKVDIIVTAENGKSRTYTIHFPVELSSDSTLNSILYGGQPITPFDAEVDNYTVYLPVGTKDVPVITVAKKDETQRVDINIHDWKVVIDVLAEDGIASMQYTIDFVLAKSDNAQLSDFICLFPDHSDSISVKPDIFEYSVLLPLGVDTLPDIDVVKTDSLQSVNILPAQPTTEGTYIASVIVTAPDEETQLEYQITFSFSRNNDAKLTMIYLDTLPLQGFRADSLEYSIVFPSGTTPEQYYTLDDCSYTLSDPLAADTAWVDDNHTVFIEVTAQDGTRNTYSIHQTTGLSDDNFLADLRIGSETIRDFDPETLFYTYYMMLGKSASPEVTAVPRSELAEISIKPGEAIGDTTRIIVTAENGDTRTYLILFAYTDIDDAQAPKPQDVLVKRIYGSTQIFVAALRSNVAFALYDRNGRQIEFIQQLPACDPNDAIIQVNANGQECFVDVVLNEHSGTYITLNPNTIYFYTFFENGKKRVASGKLVITN